MTILTITDALLQRLTAQDGRILRDRILCGFCLKAGKRSRTFLVATSCNGRQVRMTIGRWPLISVEEARTLAACVLKSCRAGEAPARPKSKGLPTLAMSMQAYGVAKRIKASSLSRYNSVLRTHFGEWLDQSVTALKAPAFGEHCHTFAQSNGAAVVELGRGLIGSLIKYLNAVHGIDIANPFAQLAHAGLMPSRAKPRQRRLKEIQLHAWRVAVDQLPERQRDYLMLIAFTGLRRNECSDMRFEDVDFDRGILTIPQTKNGKSHTLPVTSAMKTILTRRCAAASAGELLFAGVAPDHVASMAARLGAPRFMLHDLRKLVATTGERLVVGDAALRRILNHTAKRSDVLHRHYVSLDHSDIAMPLDAIQVALQQLMASSS